MRAGGSRQTGGKSIVSAPRSNCASKTWSSPRSCRGWPAPRDFSWRDIEEKARAASGLSLRRRRGWREPSAQMARRHLPRRNGWDLSDRHRRLRLHEHVGWSGHGELDQAGKPCRAQADAHRHPRPRRPKPHGGEGRPDTVDRGGFHQPRCDPRHGGRAPQRARIHHHQALCPHRSRPRHRPARRR